MGFRKMFTTSAVFCLGLVLGVAQSRASLGPKDDLDLPPTDLNRVNVGDFAPDFTLETQDGSTIALSDFRNKKDVILVFYRGHW